MAKPTIIFRATIQTKSSCVDYTDTTEYAKALDKVMKLGVEFEAVTSTKGTNHPEKYLGWQ